MRNRQHAAAILTIYDAAKMTPPGRRAITKWLGRQAIILSTDYSQLAKRYTARYLYK